MTGSENGQEQDITAELCISPKISDVDNSNSSGSSSIEKNVDENAMDLIFSSATVPDQEEDGNVEKEEAISELLLSGRFRAVLLNLGQQLPSPHSEQPEFVGPAIVESSEVLEPVEVQKKYVYQPEEILEFLETMKKISFTPFLDLIPIHHFRYHTQYQAKDET